MKVLVPLLFVTLAFSGCAELEGLLQELDGVEHREPLPGGQVIVHYVDVGQGDGVIWELPDSTFVVWDCGEPRDMETNTMVKALKRLGLTPGDSIWGLIASHGHQDHIGGCDEIFETYHIERIYETWYEGSDMPRSYERFQEKIHAEVLVGAQLYSLGDGPAALPFTVGDTLPLGLDGVEAQILWPGDQATRWDRIAEHSIVVRLSAGGVDFCFQGDIELGEEEDILNSGYDVDCEVYLAGHHGSRHASGENWLAAMSPEHTIVSFGTNSYGHPTKDALCRIQTVGSDIYFTEDGDVAVATDGVNITVSAAPQQLDVC